MYSVGPTGLGKSTLINTIFASHLIDSKGRFASDEPVRQTTEIQAVSHGESALVLISFPWRALLSGFKFASGPLVPQGLTLFSYLLHLVANYLHSHCRKWRQAQAEHC